MRASSGDRGGGRGGDRGVGVGGRGSGVTRVMVQEYRTAHTLIHQHIETCVVLCMASLSTYSDPWAMASVPRVNVASRGKGLRLAQRKARCAATWRSGSTSRSLPEPAEREALFKIFLTDIFCQDERVGAGLDGTPAPTSTSSAARPACNPCGACSGIRRPRTLCRCAPRARYRHRR